MLQRRLLGNAGWVVFSRLVCVVVMCLGSAANAAEAEGPREFLRWNALPDLPGEMGVAGPVVGVEQGGVVCAGGGEFVFSLASTPIGGWGSRGRSRGLTLRRCWPPPATRMRARS